MIQIQYILNSLLIDGHDVRKSNIGFQKCIQGQIDGTHFQFYLEGNKGVLKLSSGDTEKKQCYSDDQYKNWIVGQANVTADLRDEENDYDDDYGYEDDDYEYQQCDYLQDDPDYDAIDAERYNNHRW